MKWNVRCLSSIVLAFFAAVTLVANSQNGPVKSRETIDTLKAKGISMFADLRRESPNEVWVDLPQQIIERIPGGKFTNVFTAVRLVSDDLDVEVQTESKGKSRRASFRISDNAAEKMDLCISYRFTSKFTTNDVRNGLDPYYLNANLGTGVEYFLNIRELLTNVEDEKVRLK